METTPSATGRKKPAPKGQQTGARDLTDRTERATGGDSWSCGGLLAAGDVLAPKVRAVQREEFAVRLRYLVYILVAPLRHGAFRDAAKLSDGYSSAKTVDESRCVHAGKYRTLNPTESSTFDRVWVSVRP